MLDTTTTKSIYNLPIYQKIISVLFAFILGVIIFYIFPADATDWQYVFYPVSKVPLYPYSVKTFVNPPWAALFLYPLHYFSVSISLAINTSISFIVIGLLVIKRKGDLLSLALTLTSFPFLSLLANGSIEWIPALGFTFQNGWGLPLLLTKPQSGFLAVLPWFSSAKNKYLFITPILFTIIVSFIVWGNWSVEMIENIQNYNEPFIFHPEGISPWPWAVPLGGGLILYILKYKPKNSELISVLATYCLVPYFSPHSLIIPFALLSISHRRLSIFFWLLLWALQIFSNWAIFIQILGPH